MGPTMNARKHFMPSNPEDRAELAGMADGLALLNAMQQTGLEPVESLALMTSTLLCGHRGGNALEMSYRHTRGMAAALYLVLCRGLEADRAYEVELLLRRAVDRGGYMTNADLLDARELLNNESTD